MNNKSVGWMLGSAAAMVLTSAGLLAAHALETGALETKAGAPAEARLLVAQAEGAKATFSLEQAERGKKEFSQECVECHGKDLRGGLLGGPPLRGQSFEAKYGKGSPAGVLFEVMSSTMPPNAPGSYSDAVYADLMAHILKTNGYKSGAELPSDVDALYNLVIEK
ncbi:c-type cytochrome [Devosia sp. PTR5]|uniref:C-type cytochrome n=1 Tax=Devosia oryzisoli TaxID=2774138 RepID=A0A927FVF6_9HYPH|nr:c-type cytochrome [Devosia oryzisoli]MBD8065879.1 c-type cytochrome [Devosia oryzisoli]